MIWDSWSTAVWQCRTSFTQRHHCRCDEETADNLSGRFNDSIGAIRSWDFGSWNFPVIIDNMMNLDLLFTVSKWTGDNKYKDVAIKHAITTMKNHFRPDYTCWHV